MADNIKETGGENKYLLPDKAYKALKWLALIALPAIARHGRRGRPAVGVAALR